MKSGDVPRNIGRHPRNKFGQALQFIIAVVESGNEQRDELEPYLQIVQALNGVENGLQPAPSSR